MAISRIQACTTGTSGTLVGSLTCIFGSSCSSGNVILVFVRMNGVPVPPDPTSVTDTLSTSYSLIASIKTSDPYLFVYKGLLVSSGSNSVTVNFNGTSNYSWIFAVEYSGISGTVDTYATKWHSGATSSISSNPITTSQANELVLLVAGQNSFASYTAGTDFTLISGTIQGDSGNNFGGLEEYITSSALSSYSGTINTDNTTNDYSIIIVAMLASGGGGGGSSKRPISPQNYRRQFEPSWLQ